MQDIQLHFDPHRIVSEQRKVVGQSTLPPVALEQYKRKSYTSYKNNNNNTFIRPQMEGGDYVEKKGMTLHIPSFLFTHTHTF